MPQVTVALNGRTYRLSCGEGEEARLNELVAIIKRRIDDLAKEYGQVGDERLLLMASLLMTDELLDTKARLAQYEHPPGDDVLPPEADPLPPKAGAEDEPKDPPVSAAAAPMPQTATPKDAGQRPLIRARGRTTLEERLLEARMSSPPPKVTPPRG